MMRVEMERHLMFELEGFEGSKEQCSPRTLPEARLERSACRVNVCEKCIFTTSYTMVSMKRGSRCHSKHVKKVLAPDSINLAFPYARAAQHIPPSPTLPTEPSYSYQEP